MRYLLFIFALLPALAIAADLEYRLTIRDHRFEPSELRVPAGKKIKRALDHRGGSFFRSSSLSCSPCATRSFISKAPVLLISPIR